MTVSNQSAEDLQRLAERRARWGRIDVLVYSAGHGPRGPLHDITDAQWHAGLEIYLLTIVRPVRLGAPIMQMQRAGAITNIPTAWAFEPCPVFPTSAVIRAGRAADTRLFADSCAADDVRMGNVLPGWIDSLPATEERQQSVPLGRYGRTDEIAATIAALASDGAAYITGQNLRVDGGLIPAIWPGGTPTAGRMTPRRAGHALYDGAVTARPGLAVARRAGRAGDRVGGRACWMELHRTMVFSLRSVRGRTPKRPGLRQYGLSADGLDARA